MDAVRRSIVVMCLFPKIGITELSDAEFAVLTGFLNLLVISYALYRYLYLRSVTVFFSANR